MKPLHIFLFLFSFFGSFLLGKCVYLSDQVSDSICEQHRKFTESGELQKAVKSGSGSGSGNEGCGWYQVKKGKGAGCAAAIATFIECRIIEQRQSKKESLEKAPEGGRIVGGENAERHEFPSVVANVRNGTQGCASTIISPEWVNRILGTFYGGISNHPAQLVVTASHCVGERVLLPDFELLAGDHNLKETDEENPARQRRRVVAYQNHEMYDFGAEVKQYDIALMKVDPPFEFNENVKAVTLPDPEYRADGVFTVIGWGNTESLDDADVLHKVEVPFVDDASCNSSYSQNEGGTKVITEDMICAGLPEGGKDSCQGDSGGPLFKIDGDKQILAGIVSWGKGCALPGFPGVYTEVAFYIDWIKTHMCME